LPHHRREGRIVQLRLTHDALLEQYAQRFDLQVELTQANELLELWRG
jgi:hypothetical protein